MPRRMSCSMTVEAVRNHTKTVTRRSSWTWVGLKPGDRLTLVEKAQGIPKGGKQVVLAQVEVVANDTVLLREMTQAECAAEGFPEMTPDEFIAFWLKSHGLFFGSLMALKPNGRGPFPVSHDVRVRRIQWRYLATCASCGKVPEDGYAITDDEGTHFCGDCYQP